MNDSSVLKKGLKRHTSLIALSFTFVDF